MRTKLETQWENDKQSEIQTPRREKGCVVCAPQTFKASIRTVTIRTSDASKTASITIYLALQLNP